MAFLSKRNRKFYVDVMTRRESLIFRAFMIIWVASLYYFWDWWFSVEHIVTWPRIIINSFLIVWSSVLPAYYFFFIASMKKTNPRVSLPEGLRIAMVVTKTPSEPFSVLERTLKGMLAQKYPHDTWLADENPTPTTIAWCAQNNVKISTRKDAPEYHNYKWPRKKNTKEGNLAYFYDNYGYDKYDVVVQMDADHAPSPGYLEEMIKPFSDPKVGYVTAPSIVDANLHESWAAKARLYSEGILHGSLQAGHNAGWAPLMFGSHYAVRTKALKEIGGLGPELAEDHSTTLMMYAHGWEGAAAFEAEAHGHGPQSFPDLMIQDFQWARSLMKIFLVLTPKYWRSLRLRFKFQFVFIQLWYPIFAITMLVALFLPVIAIVTKTPWVNLSYISYIVHGAPILVFFILVVAWIKERGWLRPENSKVFSWQSLLFQFARWPWVLLGVFDAIVSVIFRREIDFKVTPKGKMNIKPLEFKYIFPYIVMVLISVAAAIFGEDISSVRGYYYFAIFNAAVYALLVMIIVILHTYEAERLLPGFHVFRWVPKLAISAVMIFLVGTAGVAKGKIAIQTIFSKDAIQIAYEDSSLNKDLISLTTPSGVHVPVIAEQNTNQNLESAQIGEQKQLGGNPETKVVSRKYTVEDGDTLWIIAERTYGNGFEWQSLVNTNSSSIGYLPNGERALINIGSELVLP